MNQNFLQNGTGTSSTNILSVILFWNFQMNQLNIVGYKSTDIFHFLYKIRQDLLNEL